MSALYPKLLDIGLVLLGTVVLICLAAPLIWVFELATHFTFYWALACLLVSACHFARRQWCRGAIGMVLCGFFGWGMAPYYWGSSDAGAAEEVSGSQLVTLVHFNLLSSNVEYVAVKAFLEQHDADIVVLQEFTPAWEKALDDLIASYPHLKMQAREGAFGSAVLSRFPFAEAKWHPDTKARLPYLESVLEVNGSRLKLVAVHAWSPSGRSKALARNDMLKHVTELAAVAEGTPVVVVGDLNCTPWSPNFRNLCRDGKLRDSALGRGIQATWSPLSLPFGIGIPIDHVLVSAEIAVRKREVGPGMGSDHRPVTAELRF